MNQKVNNVLLSIVVILLVPIFVYSNGDDGNSVTVDLDLGLDDEPDYTKTYDPNNPAHAADYNGYGKGMPDNFNSEHLKDPAVFKKIEESGGLKHLKAEHMKVLDSSQLNFEKMDSTQLQIELKRRYPNPTIFPSEGMKIDDKGILSYQDSTIDLNSMPKDKPIHIEKDKLFVGDQMFEKAENIKGEPDGSISIDSADLTRTNKENPVSIWNGQGLTIYPNGDFHVDQAEAVNQNIAVSENVFNYDQNDVEFYVEKAKSVKFYDCLSFFNVTGADFTYNSKSVKAYTENNLNITDCDNHNSELYPINNGSISIKEAIYELENTTFIIGNEKVESTSNATLILDEFGINCVQAEPRYTYYYSDYEDIRKDFALHIYLDYFEFCIKKNETSKVRPLKENNSAIFDLVDNHFYINGQIQYLRYPFKEFLTGGELYSVYDGREPNTISKLILDDNLLFIDKLLMHQSIDSPLSAVVNPSKYLSLYEGDRSMLYLTNDDSYNLIRTINSSIKNNEYFATIINNTYTRDNIATYQYSEELHDRIDLYVLSTSDCLRTYSYNCTFGIGKVIS